MTIILLPNLLENGETSWAFDSHSILLSFDPQEISLNIDMKKNFLVKFSGVSPDLNNNSWTSWLSCNVLNLGKIFHSNSIGSPSIMSKVLYSGEFFEPLQSLFPCSVWLRVLVYLTKTQYRIWKYVDFCALETLMTCSSPIREKYFHEEFSESIVFTPQHRSHLVRTPFSQICRTFVSVWDLLYSWCLSVRSLAVRDGLTIVWVILSHEYRWFQCWRHAHSPYHRMFFAIFCNIHWRSFLPFFALDHSPYWRMIWIPTTNLILLHRPQWRIAVLLFEAKNGFHRSIIHQFIRFPLWEDQALSSSHSSSLLSACFQRIGSGGLARDFSGKQRFPLSIMFHSFFTKTTCFELLRTGSSSLRANKGVSPFYHDLGLDLVGLIGNFWFVEQVLPLVVEQLLKPTLSSSHVSRKSSEAVEVIHIPSRMWLLQFHLKQLSEYNKLGVFREEW